jgi:ABC-type antimicrobial peptide transport system permease subunit
MSVLIAFAALTGTLAAIGVYGLLACVVNDRRRELAIRLALGAQPAAGLACLAPARRAARVAPVEGLKGD